MREKKLLINSILYFFGSFGKGVATIIIVFMASFYVSPSDMGVYDLVISTISLLQPIVIFQINDGIYRWLLEEPKKKECIICCGFKIAYRNIIVANIIIFIVMIFVKIEYYFLIIILLNLNCVYPLFQQITRGLKNHKIFAYSGIINGIIALSMSYILMRFFGQGVKGFYISQIVSNIAGMFYLCFTQKIKILFKKEDKEDYVKYSKLMQKYSIMLIPNSINQWMMKALDKYCILFFLTTYDNGIYTVAHRFPDILIMVNNMFYSAWVEQSIVEYESEDRDLYFSKIYNLYFKVLTSVILVLIPITKYLMYIFSGSEYQSAYLYVPFLYIGVIFLGLSSFIGTGYLGTKHTEGIMWTSLIGSLVNTVINIIFLPLFGLQVAAIAFCLSYLSMWIIRTRQTKQFFDVHLQFKVAIPLILLTLLYAFAVKLDNLLIDVVLEILALFIMFILNKEIIFGLFNKKIRRYNISI